MHSSSISYAKLSAEETADDVRTPDPPNQYIPSGGPQRVLLFFALILGTTITFFYMRYPTGYHVTEFLNRWKLENDSVEHPKADDIFREILKDDSNPSWTWSCMKTSKYNSCVRRPASEASKLQSLKTCNMICTEIPIWPHPTGDHYFNKSVVPVELRSLTLNILKSPSAEVSQYLQEAFGFMKRDIHKEAPMKHDKETINMHANKNALGLVVRVKVEDDANPRLRLNTYENYNLQIKSEGKTLAIDIKANSFCGARHGFETLSQLIWFDHFTKSVLALESAGVEDKPRFRYRGLLLDTARQYFPVADILRTIDAMAASKLNTFHWHATDSQSFPLKLNSVPQLALYGSYSQRQVYTGEDIKTIVHHARVRGIRVVIEIDAPAHVGRSWSWGNSSGLGDLAYCVEHDPWKGFCGEPPCGQLNPNNEHVYEILEKIYKEIIDLTGVDDVFHLGGDEVNPKCWNDFMKGSYFMDSWYSFIQKSTAALRNANKGKLPNMTILWSSKLTSGSLLSRMKDYTIQVWGPTKWPDVQHVPETGSHIIISNVDGWYFDCGFQSCQPYWKWKTVYNHRPWKDHKWQMEGGTACMWTEWQSPESVDARIWPRAAAVAERLWTDPPHEATAQEYLRLDMHRARLVERGVRADVIWPRWCTENPYECKLD